MFKQASVGDQTDVTEGRAHRSKQRWSIWEIPENLQCSIIGTCLSKADMLKLARRLDLHIEPGTSDYDIHAYFVREASYDGKAARSIQKELERRFRGMVRRVGRLSDGSELGALWQDAYASGQIPSAYWALLTHTHVSADLRKRAFGEVHMLSHVLGRTTHAKATKATDLSSRLEELGEKLLREADRQKKALQQRDQQISVLRAELLAARGEHKAAPAPPQMDRRTERAVRLLDSRERA